MGFLVNAVTSIFKTVVGIVSKVVGGIFGFLIGGKSSKKAKSANTLNKTLEPEAFRKIVFGKTALPLDLRFWEVWGTNGTKYDEVLAIACHRINSVKGIYFETALGFDGAGTPQGIYNGVVTCDVRLGAPGQTAMSVGSGSQWTSAATFDGCAHIKFAWIPDETKLPNGIPSRYTIIGEGAYVYDPRRDSTVAGGSGSHRANDQSTWSYATLDGNSQPIGRNNALQALWYLLGWRVQNPSTGEWVLVAGRGVDPQDINMTTFIAGANACEVAAYYTDLVLSTEDTHTSNEDKITCDGLIARLIDPGGLWSYYANVDDTASIAVELTDADIIEGSNVTWNEYKGMSEQYNQVRGKFIYPASPVLYQAFPYPMVRDSTYETNLGVKRSKPQDFEQVLDSTLAQRLARLLLNQGQYQGEFSASFNYRAVKAQAYSVVRYTSERFGFVKLFRVWRQDISTNAGVSMLLKEIHSSIWSAGSITTPLAPGLGAYYDATQAVSAVGVNVALNPVVGANGDQGDGFRIFWDTPPTNVRRTEIRYRLVGTTYWLTAGPVVRDVVQVVIAPLLSGAIYEAAVRHISIHEVPGPWIIPTTAPANGAGQFQLGTTGTVNAAAILAAGGTAVWANITGPGRPSDNAGSSNVLIPIGTNPPTLQGNSATKTGGGSFNSAIRGVAFANSCYVEVSRNGNDECRLALGQSPGNTSYADNDFYAAVTAAGVWSLYINGVSVGGGTIGYNSSLRLAYTGTSLIVAVDGVIATTYSTGITANLTLYPKVIIYWAATYTNIFMGYWQNTDFALIGGTTRPDDGATRTAIGGNELADDRFGSQWTLSAGAVRIAKIANNGFAAGSEPYCLEITPSATVVENAVANKIPIVVGQRSYFSARVSSGTTLSANCKLNIGGDWLASDGVTVVAAASEATQQTPGTLTAGSLPVELRWSQVAPAGAAYFRYKIYCPLAATPSGTFRVEAPRVSKTEAGASVTNAISGPGSANVNYDDTGTTIQAQVDLNYSLSVAGSTQTTGVTWTYTVVGGNVNGNTSASGPIAISGGGAVTFSITAMTTATATVRINASYNGVAAPAFDIAITRVLAAPPAGGGGSVSKTSGFTAINTATFTDITGTLTLTTPAGKTATSTAVSLSCQMLPKASDQIGPWNLEFKLQRLISAVWTDIGAVQNSNPDPLIENLSDPPVTVSTAGTMSATISNTGLTASTSYSYRIMARMSTGTPSGNGSTMRFTGSVNITCP